MSSIDRRLRHKEEIRESILDAAWELGVNEGWHSFTIRKLADAIEYSVPVIYIHFENKDAILLEFIRKGFSLLTEKMIEAGLGEECAVDKIEAMALAYWKFAFSNQPYYQLMFGVGIPTCEAAWKTPEIDDFREAVTSGISTLVLAGKRLIVDPSLKFQSFWSMLHGLVSINMLMKPEGQNNRPMEPALKDAILCFIKGVVY